MIKTSRKVRRRESGFWFVFPSLLILGGFGLVVTAANLWYSLQNWSALSSPSYAGLKNYQRFFSDSIALRSLANTFQYALTVSYTHLTLPTKA